MGRRAAMKKLDILKCNVGEVWTNCYLVKNKETSEGFIVDPGAEEQKLLRKIKDFGMDCRGILLTHGHFDHIMAVNALAKELKIPVYACLYEHALLSDPSLSMTDSYDGCTITPDYELADGEEVALAGVKLKVLHTPGHTPGSCCFYIPEEDILFSGDTLFFRSVGRTDFPGGSMTQMQESLHRLLEELPEEVQVLPGHELPTTIGQEKRYNPFV